MAQDTTVQSTLDELLAAMSSGANSSLAGWDVLVAYDLDAVNAQLQASYGSAGSGLPQSLSLTYTVMNQFTQQPDGTITFDVTLGAPTIAISTEQDGQCTLSMALGGSYVAQPANQPPEAPVQIPSDTYTVVVQVPIAAVTGAEGAAPATTGQVITFTDGADAASLYLQVSTTDVTQWAIDPPPAQADPLASMLPYLVDWFQQNVQDIDYALGGLSSAAPPAGAGETVITPASFIFTTMPGQDTEGGDASALCLWVCTTNTGNSPGSVDDVSFMPGGGAVMLPIPQGQKAAVYFSRDLIGRCYLAAQLTAATQSDGTTPVFTSASVDVDATGSLTVQAFANNVTIPGAYVGNMASGDAEVNDTVIDFQNSPFQFAFTSNGTDPAQLATSLTVQGETVWRSVGYVKGWPTYGPWTHTPSTLTVAQTDALSSIATVTDSSIELSVAIPQSSYQVTIHDTPSCLSGGSDGLVAMIQETIAGGVPTITVSLSGRYYFYASNLLFPGQQFFDADTTTGLNIPMDAILVGSISAAA